MVGRRAGRDCSRASSVSRSAGWCPPRCYPWSRRSRACRAPRTDPVRAGDPVRDWFLVDGLVLSFMHGTIHPYYSLSIAPPSPRSSRSACSRRGPSQSACRVGCSWCFLWPRDVELVAAGRQRDGVAAEVGGSDGDGVRVGGPAVAVGPRRAAGSGSRSGGAVARRWAVPRPTRWRRSVRHQGIAPWSDRPIRGSCADTRSGRESNPHLDALLEATGTPWSAAIDRSSSAAGLELSTGTAVMAIGGFSGTDPTPTLQQFQSDVARHLVRYYLAPRGSSKGAVAQDEHGRSSAPVRIPTSEVGPRPLPLGDGRRRHGLRSVRAE